MTPKNDFSKMSVAELFTLKDKYSKDGNLESLLELAKYRFSRGSIAMFKTIFPEIAFLYSAMHRLDELESFLQTNSLAFTMLPYDHQELTKNISEFGYRYPNLNLSDTKYLDEALKNSEIHEAVDMILKISLSEINEYRQIS